MTKVCLTSILHETLSPQRVYLHIKSKATYYEDGQTLCCTVCSHFTWPDQSSLLLSTITGMKYISPGVMTHIKATATGGMFTNFLTALHDSY